MQAAMILAIIEKVIRYGPKAIIIIAEAFKQDVKPTVDQIQALIIDKDPEDYF